MVNVQTGNMLDVVIEGKSIGLKQRDSDHRKHEVIWLPEPEGLRDVLATEIARLNPSEKQTTNSLTSDEREQRLKQIQERVNERALYVDPPLWEDIEFLLLQITPPVLTLEESDLIIGAIPIQSGLLDDPATAMRTACVEKVKAIPAKTVMRETSEEVRGAASFKADAIAALESLQVEQEKQ